MENNSRRLKELDTGDGECSARKIRRGEERKDEEKMTVTMANLAPDDKDNKRGTITCMLAHLGH